MGTLRELLAVDHRQTLEFFVAGLKDVSEDDVNRQELLYNASVLAHYAQVSTEGGAEFPTPATLGSVFDHFVSDGALRQDAAMMETAGAHCLLMAGFFAAQMRHRHNVRWYADLGAAFFFRAAMLERSPAKALLMDHMARGFEPWRQRHARLGHELRGQPYLLSLITPKRTM